MTKVIVLIPAHNEEDRIVDAILSAKNQSRKPDQIVVMSDNSTDATVQIAQNMGVDVVESIGNDKKKAGALNQALQGFMETEDDETHILVMDADSKLSSVFIETAMKYPDAAVGGIFFEDGLNGLLGKLQGLEWVRFSREVARRKAKAMVLSGTSTFLKLGDLRKVAELRGTQLPGTKGEVYNTDSIVEDFDLTLCLKTIGIQTISPKECSVITETMPTIPMLWKQRTRWQRGTLETLLDFGVNRVTLPYYGQQLLLALRVFTFFVLWTFTAYTWLIGFNEVSLIWVSIGVIFYIERLVGALRGSRTHILISITLLLDILYDILISVINVSVWFEMLLRKEAKWGITTIDKKG